jgi:catechol 2,3-dioxygenase-like lactoylglutathione lyase family enzyme
MAGIGMVVLNVGDVQRAARFYTEALGYRLRNDPIGDDSAVLVPRDGDGPAIVLDESDRMHLDLQVADEAAMHAEVERLIGLGAQRAPWTYPDGAGFVVLQDTEGNLFCVVNSSRH